MTDPIRAALSQPEPAGLSDEELLKIAEDSCMDRFEGERRYSDKIAIEEGYWEAWNHQLLNFARAAIAADRAQRHPAPVPTVEGEVGELIKCLRIRAASLSKVGANLSQRGDAIYFTHAADLLEQRQPVEPLPGEVQELVKWLREQEGWMGVRAIYSRIADLLAQRYPQPVPVSEGLPGPDDCDAEGRCWWFCFECPGEHSYWILAKKVYCAPTYWRPAHALPLPVEVVKEPPDNRDPECVANWPECRSGGYDPRCCRFPKSCSCERGPALPGEVEE